MILYLTLLVGLGECIEGRNRTGLLRGQMLDMLEKRRKKIIDSHAESLGYSQKKMVMTPGDSFNWFKTSIRLCGSRT